MSQLDERNTTKRLATEEISKIGKPLQIRTCETPARLSEVEGTEFGHTLLLRDKIFTLVSEGGVVWRCLDMFTPPSNNGSIL